ncbi:MAG: hypothetical protein IKR97_03760 [Eubacterium sp.]|nr:hypothetical protein [Eubacterium sp.]
MRTFYVLVIIFDIMILLMGVLVIADKYMRRRRVEHHFIFRPFIKGDKKGYALYDDEEKYVYYAVKEKEEDDYSLYTFKDCGSKQTSTHKVSVMLRNNNAPNYSGKTFMFDDKEVWGILSKRGYFFQKTIVNESLKQYKIRNDSKIIGYIRNWAETPEQYSLRTYDRKLDNLFLLLFAIARTEKKHSKSKKTDA